MLIRSFAAKFLTVLTLCPMATQLFAVNGDPLAVRNWPAGVVSVETYWGLRLAIDPDGIGDLKIEADRTISPIENVNHYLFRKPNETMVAWQSVADAKAKDPNAVHVRTVRHFGNEPMLQIEADGVQIVYVPGQWFDAHSNEDTFTVNLQQRSSPDLLVLDTDDLNELQGKGVLSLLKFTKPKAILLNRIDSADQAKTAAIANRFGKAVLVSERRHNTVALSSTAKDRPMQVIVTSDKPWAIPNSISEMFGAMEKANADSQAVFARLSAKQMNFKPANGTHTPRWNTEHMMGRQLWFFSQIYHAQNPVIPIMNLNPEQMPPDYVFAHPDWDGREEARQMQRVSEFTRRFAHLLEGVPLDVKAPGSRWTLRRLLHQMQRHYGEHTANTIKKFELPGWPTE